MQFVSLVVQSSAHLASSSLQLPRLCVALGHDFKVIQLYSIMKLLALDSDLILKMLNSTANLFRQVFNPQHCLPKAIGDQSPRVWTQVHVFVSMDSGFILE